MTPPAVGRRLEALAFEIAVESFDGQVVDELIPGYQMLSRRRLVEPLPGVRAARALTNAARRLLVDHVEAARAAGCSWDEIGEALGLSDDAGEEPRAEVAFNEIAEGRRRARPWPTFEAPSISWRCGSCGEWVRDYGTGDSSHPADQESGHAPTCARHAADVEVWNTRTGWDK